MFGFRTCNQLKKLIGILFLDWILMLKIFISNLKRTLGNKYEHLWTCDFFLVAKFCYFCVNFPVRKNSMQNVFYQWKFMLPQRRENTTKHWYEHIKTKKTFVKQNLKNLKNNHKTLNLIWFLTRTKTLNLMIWKSKYEKVNGVKLSSWTPYNRLCKTSLIVAPISFVIGICKGKAQASNISYW